MQKDGMFYANNLFAEINAFNSEQKRLQAEADAKRIAEEKKRKAEAEQLAEEKKKQEEAEAKRIAEEKKREEEAERLAEEKKKQEEAEAKRLAEEKKRQEAKRIAEESTKQISAVTKFDPQSMLAYIDEFGYLRKIDASELAELKSVLLTAPKNNYQAQFLLGQLYIQENTSASNLSLAYNAIKTASENGVYEAGAFMAYFYLYGKVVTQDLDEAERRIKIDDDFKKNPIFVQMMIDLYVQKGNAMLADVWKSKLKKLK
jgi:TPR repeat protein